MSNYKHGYKHHPHYGRWKDLTDRCYSPNHKRFADYGGRGITVTPEWRRDAGPQAFCNWLDKNLGPCPEGMSIDRINNDGNYEPGNVRWATSKEQNDNSRPDKPHSKKSNLPTGVCPNGKRFQAQIRSGGKRVYLGTFDTPEEASEIYQFAKLGGR